MCMHHTSYLATPEENQIDSYAYENGMSNVLLRGYSRVNPVVHNELQDKTQLIRIGQRRGQRGIVLRDQTAFSLFVVAEKRENTLSLDMRGYVQG